MTDNPLAEVRAALEYISENIFDEVNIRFVSETERQIKRALAALSRIESHNALADGDVLQNDVVAAVTPLIRAEVLEEAAQVAEKDVYPSNWAVAARIRALKEQPWTSHE